MHLLSINSVEGVDEHRTCYSDYDALQQFVDISNKTDDLPQVHCASRGVETVLWHQRLLHRGGRICEQMHRAANGAPKL